MKQKWYVVWKGKTPGIYDNWDRCKAQVHGVDGAKYKSFKTKDTAEAAYRDSYKDHVGLPKPKTPQLFDTLTQNYVTNSLCVDAACSGNPGQMEFQGVWTDTKELGFASPVYPVGTNNLGEFLAIVQGVQYLIDTQKTDAIIYTDSMTAMAWIRNKAVKTTLQRFPETEQLWQEIDLALDYIKTHPITIDIQKWQTDEWGEIHADFGRK